MLFTGLMPADSYTLIFVTRCPNKGRSFNFATEHVDGYMGFFPPGGELDAYTPEGYANATLTVPAELFHRAIEQGFPEIPEKILKQGAGMRISDGEQIRLRALLNRVMDGIVDPSTSFSSASVRSEVEVQLLEVFVRVLRDGLGHVVARPKCRVAGKLKHLREAREFISATAQGPLQIDDLSRALGMSSRGVEVLFHSSLGIGPNAYIRHQRLHGVRRELLVAAPEFGVVKELAMRWGFWHMGHFAKNYRSLFGESPTTTLVKRT